ncbi:MAG: hypothetical protein A4E28_02053 [Methanocella sp. PtaU1.Bin125]|nr:MAG: hypothetical protein A4E28_02053 [Methanocella sp. PtaU1.Bin125]
MADLIHVSGKKRRRLMLVTIALLIVAILAVCVNLAAPVAFAQDLGDWGDWEDWDTGSSSSCCCCCAAAILPLAGLGLTYSWQADRKEGD